MGCKVSKSSDLPDSPAKGFPSLNREVSFSIKTQSTGVKDLATSVRDFRVSHSDLISEKSGKIGNDYSMLLPAIGRGAYGEVRRAVHRKTNITRAVKIIYKKACSVEEQERMINEANVLKNLDHPHIMKIIEFYQDDKHLYIVSELYTGGELFEKISALKIFTENESAYTIRQILSAVFYCHQHKIVHRDLKPENILYESRKPGAVLKVIDFGTSKMFDSKTKMNQKFGTPYYIAPEVIRKRYTEKCDVWSCGIILYILLCGHPPFNGATDKIIMEKVAIGRFNFDGKEWKHISDDAKSLISRMLEFDPKLRCSAGEAFQDKWLKAQLGTEEIDKPLAISALTNLRTFRAERKLQEATWVFLVTYMASKEEKNELLKTFQALDLNGDGQLTKEELVTGYQNILNIANAEEEVDKIMQTLDNNGNGAIDYTEFVVATINRQTLLSKERLEAVFKLFDKDGNGYLTADELQEVFAKGKDVDSDVWPELIREVDQNSDGKISYKEFKEMMLKFIK